MPEGVYDTTYTIVVELVSYLTVGERVLVQERVGLLGTRKFYEMANRSTTETRDECGCPRVGRRLCRASQREHHSLDQKGR
jgi:hypothetical protein